MCTRPLHDAKSRFPEPSDTAERQGAQRITPHGIDRTALATLETQKRLAEWRRTTPPTPPQLPTQELTNAELLTFLQSAPDFEIPDRHAERLKKPSRR